MPFVRRGISPWLRLLPQVPDEFMTALDTTKAPGSSKRKHDDADEML